MQLITWQQVFDDEAGRQAVLFVFEPDDHNAFFNVFKYYYPT